MSLLSNRKCNYYTIAYHQTEVHNLIFKDIDFKAVGLTPYTANRFIIGEVFPTPATLKRIVEIYPNLLEHDIVRFCLNFFENIRAAGLTVNEVARGIGIHFSTLHYYKKRNTKTDTIYNVFDYVQKNSKCDILE